MSRYQTISTVVEGRVRQNQWNRALPKLCCGTKIRDSLGVGGCAVCSWKIWLESALGMDTGRSPRGHLQPAAALVGFSCPNPSISRALLHLMGSKNIPQSHSLHLPLHPCLSPQRPLPRQREMRQRKGTRSWPQTMIDFSFARLAPLRGAPTFPEDFFSLFRLVVVPVTSRKRANLQQTSSERSVDLLHSLIRPENGRPEEEERFGGRALSSGLRYIHVFFLPRRQVRQENLSRDLPISFPLWRSIG